MIRIENYNVEDLTQSELKSTEGGFIQYVLGAIAILGATYAAGTYVGEAYYHYTH